MDFQKKEAIEYICYKEKNENDMLFRIASNIRKYCFLNIKMMKFYNTVYTNFRNM